MIRRLEDLLPQLTIGLADCPDPVRLDALRESFDALCRSAFVWEQAKTVTIVQDRSEYAIRCEGDCEVLRVKLIYNTTTGAEIPRVRYNCGMLAGGGGVRIMFDEFGGLFYSASDELRVTMSLVPASPTAMLPDELIRQHFATLLQGARAKLHMQSGVPWSNAALGAVESRTFSGMAGRARVMVETAFTGRSVGLAQ